MGFRMVGANCCCGSCVLFEDDFDRADSSSLGDDWDVISGSPEIVGQRLRASTSALVVADAGYAKAAPLVARATIHGIDHAGAIARVIVAYTSSTNYLYAQLECVSAFNVALKLFQRSTFATTQLGSTRTLPGFAGSGVLTVCYQDQILAADVNYQDSSLVQQQFSMSDGAVASGERVGLGVGGGTDIEFDDFELLYHENEQTGCPNCGRFCAACEDEQEPTHYQVTIAGVTGTYECANGTYLIPAGNCGGELVIEDCDDSLFPLGLAVIESFGTYLIRVVFAIPCGFGSSSYRWEAEFEDPVPCLTLEDYELTGMGYTNVCLSTGFDTATCHVTAL